MAARPEQAAEQASCWMSPQPTAAERKLTPAVPSYMEASARRMQDRSGALRGNSRSLTGEKGPSRSAYMLGLECSPPCLMMSMEQTGTVKGDEKPHNPND